MRRSCDSLPKSAAALFAAVLASPAVAAEGADPAFASSVVLATGNSRYEMVVSEDKQAGIVMFDGVEEQLDGIGAPPTSARVFSISLPVEGGEKGAKIGVFLEGSVARLKGTDVSLVTTVNGEAHAMDFATFPPGTSNVVSNEACKEFRAAEQLEAVRKDFGAKQPESRKRRPEARKPNAGDTPKFEIDSSYVQCILLDAPTVSDLRVNMILALHRHDRDGFGHLNVTSVSFSVQPKDEGGK